MTVRPGMLRAYENHNESMHFKNLPLRAHHVRYSLETGCQCFIPHLHGEIELLHMLRGALDLEVGGERFTVTAGETVMINRYEAHAGYVNPGAGISEYCYTTVDLTELQKNERDNLITELISGTALFHRRTGNAAVGAAIDEMAALNEAEVRAPSADMRILSMLYGILAELEEEGHIRHGVSGSEKRTQFVCQVMEFFETHYMTEITPEMICRKFSYSHSHFCRLFKQSFGKPMLNYLMEYRISMAIRLYMSGDAAPLPIGEIAQRVGIPDQCRFSHSFKKIVGISPSEYMNAKASRTT